MTKKALAVRSCKAIVRRADSSTLRRVNSYSKEALYVIYGVKDDNTRELLLPWKSIQQKAAAEVWPAFLA